MYFSFSIYLTSLVSTNPSISNLNVVELSETKAKVFLLCMWINEALQQIANVLHGLSRISSFIIFSGQSKVSSKSKGAVKWQITLISNTEYCGRYHRKDTIRRENSRLIVNFKSSAHAVDLRLPND